MILEAFGKHLQSAPNRGRKPETVLFEWLTQALLEPPAPDDTIGKVLHAEIAMLDCNGFPAFEGRSDTGRTLLASLYQYCRSFDHWQFSRWLHERQASDFSQAGNF